MPKAEGARKRVGGNEIREERQSDGVGHSEDFCIHSE